MKSSDFIFEYNGKAYEVFVTKRYQRNIYFRYRADGFHVSAPHLTARITIVNGLKKYADKLIKQFETRNNSVSLENDAIYLLGKKYQISALNLKNSGELQGFLKNKALEILTEIVRKNEAIMGIKEPYKIKVKKTVAQFGSNSKSTHTLSFQINLIHYSKEIIESVVIHELAHDKHRNHQKEFYDVVYKYCPEYKTLQRKLKKGIHE